MGGTTFDITVFGKTVDEAFDTAKDISRSQNGHQEGYSGDIQRKDSYKLIPKGTVCMAFYESEIREIMITDPEIGNSYGPAGALVLYGKRDKEWRVKNNLVGKRGVVVVFFGWARC